MPYFIANPSICVCLGILNNFTLIHFENFKVDYKAYVCSQFFRKVQEIAWSVEV